MNSKTPPSTNRLKIVYTDSKVSHSHKMRTIKLVDTFQIFVGREKPKYLVFENKFGSCSWSKSKKENRNSKT